MQGAIPRHKGGAWQPKRSTRTIPKRDNKKKQSELVEHKFVAREWTSRQVRDWFQAQGCEHAVLDDIELHEIDGIVMDEIVSVRDHLALEELGLTSSTQRHGIIRAWLRMKPSDANDPYVTAYTTVSQYEPRNSVLSRATVHHQSAPPSPLMRTAPGWKGSSQGLRY